MTYSLSVRGRSAVVLGGGPRAAAEVAALRDAGADVLVVAAELGDALLDLVERGLVVHRTELPGDLRPSVIVDAEADAAQDPQAPVDSAATSSRTGTVTLVGAGPGDPGLLTLAGKEALDAADVVVTDRLVPWQVLRDLPPTTTVVDVAKIPFGPSTPQDDINRLLVEHALAGRDVVRLKGGDSFVFGRGGEEVVACAKAGVTARVVPGVSSSISVPALAGIPVTHRGAVQGFTVVSGHVPPDHPDSTLDYPALARTGTTLVVLMGVRTLPAITAALVAAGLPSHTPAAVVADGGLPSQRQVRGPVESIATLADEAGIGSPAVAVIGVVADLEGLP